MGIWVRSQDKKSLLNCSDIHIGFSQGSVCVWGIVSDLTEGPGTMLGKYNSEAEAMQVLDMVQERILEFTAIQLAGPAHFTGYAGNVFQMPEAGFSTQSENFIPDCRGDFCGLTDPEKADEIKEGQCCDDMEKCKAAWERGCR
jgi:hypothetical protein